MGRWGGLAETLGIYWGVGVPLGCKRAGKMPAPRPGESSRAGGKGFQPQ